VVAAARERGGQSIPNDRGSNPYDNVLRPLPRL